MRKWLAMLVVFAQVAGSVAEAAHAHQPAGMAGGGASIAHASDGAQQDDAGSQASTHHGCDRCSHSLGHSIANSTRGAAPPVVAADPPAERRATRRDDTCPSLPFEPPR